MSAFDRVVGAVEQFKPAGQGRGMARCPAHKDRRASLSIRETDSGSVLLHCFAGCHVEQVVATLGLQMEDLFPPRPATDGGRPVDRKPYSARQVIEALQHELRVAWIILADLAAGKDITPADRRRAGLARERCMALIDELRLAH